MLYHPAAGGLSEHVSLEQKTAALHPAFCIEIIRFTILDSSTFVSNGILLLKLLFERGQEDTKTAAPGESGVPPKEKGRRGMEPYTNINVKKIKL